MGGTSNNNSGKNEIPAKLTGNLHLDLGPTAGTVDLKGNGVLGETFTLAALKTAVATLAPVYPDATAFVATDNFVEVEADLDYIGGEGFHLGDVGSPVVATTEDAAYKNNNGWTDIDAGGGRQDGKDGVTIDPSTFQEIWVANGSVVTLHIAFQKA